MASKGPSMVLQSCANSRSVMPFDALRPDFVRLSEHCILHGRSSSAVHDCFSRGCQRSKDDRILSVFRPFAP